jgi:hypothetical protein
MLKHLFLNRARFFFLCIRGIVWAVFLCACASIVQNKSVSSLDDPGRALYLDKCGSCHRAFPAHSYTDSQWPSVVADMAGEAELSNDEIALILSFLEENN